MFAGGYLQLVLGRPMKIIIVITLLAVCTCAYAQKTDEDTIKTILASYSSAIASKDIAKVMSFYAPDIVAFDAFPPQQYRGAAAYKKDYEDFFGNFPGPATSKIDDAHVEVSGNIAFTYGMDHWMITGKDGKQIELVFRFTDVLKKLNGTWLIVHEHLSFPVDPTSGQADFLSKP